jgi:dTDP-4-dehydrorhamnose reductase
MLLGSSGKLGQALVNAFSPQDEVSCHNSRTFAAEDFSQVRELIARFQPEILFNTVSLQGIDQCEKEPAKALHLNALLPRLLAECAAAGDFTLVHFSTDSVFNDGGQTPYGESATPCPLNTYGLTKYGGDCFVQNLAKKYYLCRLPLLFGPDNRQSQFVERMLVRARCGEPLRVAGDVISSPTLSTDAALAVMALVEQSAPFGLYHVSSSGQASLYELICRLVDRLGLAATVQKAGHGDFPAVGRKNTLTPLRSEKIPPLRPWEEAVDEYCRVHGAEWRHHD